ncbi:MAG: hypothetical protein ACOZCL_18145 [Bacillota bacterium]
MLISKNQVLEDISAYSNALKKRTDIRLEERLKEIAANLEMITGISEEDKDILRNVYYSSLMLLKSFNEAYIDALVDHAVEDIIEKINRI